MVAPYKALEINLIQSNKPLQQFLRNINTLRNLARSDKTPQEIKEKIQKAEYFQGQIPNPKRVEMFNLLMLEVIKSCPNTQDHNIQVKAAD